MTLIFINWITAANWLQGSMKLQTPLSNKHQFVPTHDFTWTFKACYMHSGTTSESIFEHVSSETDCSKEPNRNDSLFQSWPTQTASGSALRMRSTVLRAAFCWRDEGIRFVNNRPRCWWEKRGYTGDARCQRMPRQEIISYPLALRKGIFVSLSRFFVFDLKT